MKHWLTKKPNCDVIICTPFIHLASVTPLVDAAKIGVGAENCADKASGAYTGEVSAEMVASTGAKYVILGALINQLLLLFRQAVPAFVGEYKYGGGVNVVGQRQVFLHLIEAGRNDVGEGVFLTVHSSLLQSGVELGECQNDSGG